MHVASSHRDDIHSSSEYEINSNFPVYTYICHHDLKKAYHLLMTLRSGIRDFHSASVIDSDQMSPLWSIALMHGQVSTNSRYSCSSYSSSEGFDILINRAPR